MFFSGVGLVLSGAVCQQTTLILYLPGIRPSPFVKVLAVNFPSVSNSPTAGRFGWSNPDDSAANSRNPGLGHGPPPYVTVPRTGTTSVLVRPHPVANNNSRHPTTGRRRNHRSYRDAEQDFKSASLVFPVCGMYLRGLLGSCD